MRGSVSKQSTDSRGDAGRSGVTKGVEDEIVITGMSGRFPESESLEELWDNLMSREDMIKVDDRRWPVGVYEVDTFGKLKDISRFDAPFFNFKPEEAEQCAPDVRIMLEVAWEAIVDAGYDPKCLENTPTGVYIGNCIVEAGEALTNNVNTITATGLLNSMHTSLPNKVSEYFKFTGPSETHDTGCSASLYSLDTAVMAMKRGDISAALIGGCNLNLKPQATTALHRMNMVSSGRGCRVYDKSADGYSRAECISLVLLQWRSQARRIYGRIVNTVTNNDGFKEEGIIFPDSRSQISLLKEAYAGTCVREQDVVYVEAHGTGTQAGDTQECLAVDTFFCSKRDKDQPLLIGSIKSNLGHAEPASGVASLCKVLMSYTRGVIPPNILLNEINPKLEAVVQGRLKIVTEPTPLAGSGLVSLNAFGFGGSNAHVILLPNDKDGNGGEADVFFVSGRTEKAVDGLLDLAVNRPSKGLQDLYAGLSTISSYLYPTRGFVLLDSEGEVEKRSVFPEDCVHSNDNQVWLLLGGLGSQWVGMGRGLMDLAIFRTTMEHCQSVLTELGADLDVKDLLCSEESDICDDVVPMFVGLTCFVAGLLEVLKAAELRVDGVIGHSLGDTLCGLALGIHSLSEVVKSAYIRSRLIASRRSQLHGSMYGIPCSPEHVTDHVTHHVTHDVSIACYNAANHVTLAVQGGIEKLNHLTDQGFKLRQVSSGGFAFHTSRFRSIHPDVTGLMGFVGQTPRPPSWISTSYPADQQPHLIGPAFFADNLCNPVYFHQNLDKIPKGATVVELSGNSSLLSLLSQDLKKVGLVKFHRDPRNSLLAGVGELYVSGLLQAPYSILPPPVYPTPRDTPTLSSAVATGWKHTHSWWVPSLDEFLISSNDAKLNKFVSTYDITDTKTALGMFMSNYSVLGRPMVPLSLGVYVAWQSFARANDVAQENTCVQLTDVTIHNQLDLSILSPPVKLCVGVLPSTGYFHITYQDVLFMSGQIETHDPLQECSHVTRSSHVTPAASVLEFLQLMSDSNDLIGGCDLEEGSCDLIIEEQESDNLLLLDTHFQMLQVEQMLRAPFSYLTGASSIVLDGRGFRETDQITTPHPGSCRSDAVWMDGAAFSVLLPARARNKNYKSGSDLLYSNLLGSTILLHGKTFSITHILPALSGELHVCYAARLYPRDHDNKTRDHSLSRDAALGILSIAQILDSSDLELSQHFFCVDSEESLLSPDVVGSIAVSLCLLKILQLNKPKSVVVIADSETDILASIFAEILGKRCTEVSLSLVTSQTQLSEVECDCAVNLSTNNNVLELLAATGRCGSALNLLMGGTESSNAGMSALLKNLSVVNFQAGFVKLSSYWTLLRSELKNALPDIVVLEKIKVAMDTTNTSLHEHVSLYVTVTSKCSLIRAVIQDFFRQRPHITLTFTTEQRESGITLKLSPEITDFTATSPSHTSYCKSYNPAEIRAWLGELLLLKNQSVVMNNGGLYRLILDTEQ